MITLKISEKLRAFLPEVVLSCIESDVMVCEHFPDLWEEIAMKTGELAVSLRVEDISRIPAIDAS
ncbi:MAG: hypothetical protein PHS40_08090, partial [Mariniphaga sp.]|nr:hypothetical protein [Mariniphaga sp.]